MEPAKIVALVIQLVSVSILVLTFLGIGPDAVPRIIQPLFLIPWYLLVILFVGLLAVVITTKQKITQIRNAPPAPPTLQKVDTVEYKGVSWDILAPAQHPLEKPADYARRLPEIGEVKITPRCPKCGIELEEKKGMLFGHIWRCVACGFSKRNSDSFGTEAGRAGKIWKAKAEAAAVAAVAGTATPAESAPAAPAVPKE